MYTHVKYSERAPPADYNGYYYLEGTFNMKKNQLFQGSTRTTAVGTTFERLRATWISVEPRTLLVTLHLRKKFVFGRRAKNSKEIVCNGETNPSFFH